MAIKSQKVGQGKKISVNSKLRESTNNSTPIFCLEYIQPEYCLSKRNKDEKAAFATTLHKRSQMTWGDIIQAGKHKSGCETIKRDAIKASIPSHLTEDVRFIALRFNGKAPIVGFRESRVFHILWIDRAFKLYQH